MDKAIIFCDVKAPVQGLLIQIWNRFRYSVFAINAVQINGNACHIRYLCVHGGQPLAYIIYHLMETKSIQPMLFLIFTATSPVNSSWPCGPVTP